MRRGTMHQTTMRFEAELWTRLVSAAERAGVSAAQYVRRATLVQLALEDGPPERDALPTLGCVACGDEIRADEVAWVERPDGTFGATWLGRLTERERRAARRVWHRGCIAPQPAD